MESLTIALKDLRSLRRERTIGLVLALLLFVASFSSLVVTGITLLYSPTGYANARVGLVGNARIFETIVHPVVYEDLAPALRDLTNGKLDAIVVFNENVSSVNYITVYVPKEDVKAIKAILFLRKKLEEYQNVLRRIRGIPTLRIVAYENGRVVEVPEGYSLKFKFVYVMLIPLLALTTAVVSSAFVIDSVCEEFEKNTVEVLLTAVDLSDVVIGKVTASLILSTTLTVFWMIMLTLNGIEIHDPLSTFLATLSVCLFMTSLALLSVSYEPVREKAQILFSLAVISFIVVMFSFPSSPLGALARASSGSNSFVIPHLILSLSSLILTLFVSEKRLSKAIGLDL